MRERTENAATNDVTRDGRKPMPSSESGRRRSGRRNEAIVGLAIVVAVALVFFGVRYLENRPLFGGTYSLVTTMPSAGGLTEGSSVTVSGVKVGEVKEVRLDPQSHRVHVRLDIRGGVSIPRGSVAKIEGIAALDDVHLAIDTQRGSGEALVEGDQLISEQPTGLTQRADSALATAGYVLEDARGLIATTERDLSVVLANMQVASGEAAALMESESARMRATIVSLQAAVSQLNRVTAQLDRVATEGGDTLIVAMNRLNSTMAQMDRAAGSIERSGASMEQFMTDVNTVDGTLGRLVHDPGLYVRMDSAAARLDTAAARISDLIDDFMRDPGKYLGKMELIDIF